MSIAHYLSIMAHNRAQMVPQIIPSSGIVPIVFGRAYKAITNGKCDWYDNFTRVIVSVQMDISVLPEGFWTFTSAYGEVLGKAEYMAFSQLFGDCGFKLLSCGHRLLDVPGVPIGTHIVYFNLEIIGYASTTPQPDN
jgi:hypothetical protein